MCPSTNVPAYRPAAWLFLRTLHHSEVLLDRHRVGLCDIAGYQGYQFSQLTVFHTPIHLNLEAHSGHLLMWLLTICSTSRP